MSNKFLAYGLACDSEKYFDRESIQTVKDEAGLASAMKAHGLDYQVEAVQLEHPLKAGSKIPWYATVRMDTGRVLGCGLTSRYKVIQNTSGVGVIADLAQQQPGGVVFARGMTFDQGRVAVAQIDLGEMVIGDTGRGGFVDRVKKRITWTNAHDGSGSAAIFTTPIRIVCANTLTAAMGGAADGIKIRHTESAQDRLDEAKHILKVVNGELVRAETTYNVLASKRVTNDHIRAVLEKLFPTEGKTASRGGKGSSEAVETVKHYYQSADGGRIDPNTGWNLYNALTHYFDHTAPVRVHGTGDRTEARAASTLTGAIASKNAAALKEIVHVLDAQDDISRILKGIEESQAMQIAQVADTKAQAAQGNLLEWMLQD